MLGSDMRLKLWFLTGGTCLKHVLPLFLYKFITSLYKSPELAALMNVYLMAA